MMRFLLINVLTVGVILLSAASASAISIFFANLSSTGPLSPGDNITIQLRMDTEGDTTVNAVGVSVFVDPSVLGYVSGVSPGSILFNFSTFEGVPRIVQPFVIGSDPLGNIRAASFGSLLPSNIASGNQLLATLTFVAVGGGTVNIASLFQAGDDILLSGASAPSVTFGNSALITVVPEPTTALLMGLGLAGLAGAGRRQS